MPQKLHTQKCSYNKDEENEIKYPVCRSLRRHNVYIDLFNSFL